MVRRYLRRLVVQVPQLQELRAAARRAVLKTMRKPFEPEFEIFRRFIPNNDECAVDIGANRGQSVDAIRMYQPHLPIVCFEPNPALADQLSGRFEQDPFVTVEAVGLSDAESDCALYLPYYGDYMFDGMASIDHNEAVAWLSTRTLVGFDEEKLRIREIAITLQTLDAQALKPGFIKIDVEGAEAAVIAGGRKTIEALKPVFLIETGNNDALVSDLCGLGYQPFNYRGGVLQPRTHAARNTIFVYPGYDRGLASMIARTPQDPLSAFEKDNFTGQK